jgi:phage-related protein
MASNSIGTGALILTADTSKLLDGLDEMASGLNTRLRSIAENIDGRVGRLFGKIGDGIKLALGFSIVEAGKDAISGAINRWSDLADRMSEAVAKAKEFGLSIEEMQGLQYAAQKTGVSVDELAQRFKAGDESVASFIDEAKQLGYVLDGNQAKGIDNAKVAIDRAAASLDGLVNRFLAKLAPAIEAIADDFTLFDTIEAVLDGIAQAAVAIVDVGIPAFQALFAAIKELGGYLGNIISSWFDFGNASITARDVVLGVLRGLGVAIAYVWDTLKVGAGVINTVIGGLVKVIGYAIEGFAELVGVAKELPDELRPEGLDNFIAAVDKASARTKQVGDALIKGGTDAVTSFGDSAKAVNTFFDGIANKQRKTLEVLSRERATLAEQEKAFQYKDVAAAQRGSQEALNILTRSKVEALVGSTGDVAQKQLQAQQGIRTAVNATTAAVKAIKPVSLGAI